MALPFIPNLNEIGGLSAELALATGGLEYNLSDREVLLWITKAMAKLAGGAMSAAINELVVGGNSSIQRLLLLTAASMVIAADRVDGVFWKPEIIGKDGTTVIATPDQKCFYVRWADTAWFTINLSFNIPDTYEQDTIYVTIPSGLMTTAGDPSVGTTFMPSLVLQDTSTFETRVSADDDTPTLIKLFIPGETFTSSAAVIKIGAQLLTNIKDVI